MNQLTSSIALTLYIFLFSLPVHAQSTAGPKRIVSLAPSITKSLYLLGAQDKLVAVTIYCPPEAAAKDKIGTVLEPNLEKIVAISPDLVIATKDGNNYQTVADLRRLGINTYVVDTADTYPEICKSFKKLAKAVGEEEAGLKVIENCDKRLSAVLKRAKNRKKPFIFWQVGAQPIYTASRKSFVNEFIEYGGGLNLFGDLNDKYPKVSREEVLKRDPDIIIMVSMGDVTLDEKTKWQGFPSLKAARSGHIYMLDDPLFTNPTPEAVAKGSEIVEELIRRSEASK